MSVQAVERKLAAIFAADIAAYSRLMSQDEVGTLARLRDCGEVMDRLIATHGKTPIVACGCAELPSMIGQTLLSGVRSARSMRRSLFRIPATWQ